MFGPFLDGLISGATDPIFHRSVAAVAECSHVLIFRLLMRCISCAAVRPSASSVCEQSCTVLSLSFAADSRRLILSLRRRSHHVSDVDERVSPCEFPGSKRENTVFFSFHLAHSKCASFEVFLSSKSVFPTALHLAMDRYGFVRQRSSSSQSLATSALDDVRAERAAIALSVGVKWPPGRYAKGTPGRPTRQQLWERALQEHILKHHELPQGTRLQRPGWWRPGEAIDRALTHEELASVETHAAAPPAGPVEDEPSGSRAKRRKIHVHPIARDWFLDMQEQWQTERNWDMQRCLSEAKRFCPDMFDHVHQKTPYRWKRSAARPETRGRKSMLSPADMTRLSEHIMKLTDVLCMSAVTIHGLVLEWLDAEGLDVRPSYRWVKRLLHGMRLSCKKPAKCLKELHSPEQQHANAHRMFVKLCWLMDTHAVGADRVVNIDETSCRLLPVHQTGWSRRGVKQAQLQGNTKEATTFTVAFSRDRGPLDMLVQIVHSGKTAAVLPEKTLAGAHPPRHFGKRLGLDHQLVAALDDVLNPGWDQQAWILLWDLASIHGSEATLAAMKAAFPHVVLAFLPPQSTSYLQPCDVAVFRSFKSCIQTQASATLARAVLDGTFDGLAMNKPWRRQSSAEWASRAVKDLCDANQVWATGWRQLRADSNDEFVAAVAHATDLHAAGELFARHRARPL